MSEEKQMLNPYYSSLRRRMMTIVITVSFAPMILVGILILSQFRISYQEKVLDHLAELVLKHKQNIDTFLKEKLSDIRYLSELHSIEQFTDETFLQKQLTLLQKDYGGVFEDLGIVNQNGIQIAYSGPFRLAKAHYSDADWFKKAIVSDYFVSDVFMGLRGFPHFIVTVKIIWDGEPWILRSTINFVAFNSLVENLRVGKTGFAFILNKNGEFQTKPIIRAIPSEEVGIINREDVEHLPDFLKTGKKTPDDVYMLEKKNGSGGNNIYVGAFLKDGDWILIFQQSLADALIELKRTQYIAIGIFLVGGLGIIIMAFVMTGSMVKRIAIVDREKEMLNQQVIETGKLASIGELAAGIAHEINNPVAIMVEEAGWIQDLLGEEEFKEGENLVEFYRALKQIQTQGRRCKEITHKLLSFARRTESKIQSLDLNELVEDMASLSAQRAKYANVTIDMHLDENLPRLELSHTEMQQVLLNMINNALDAMGSRKGGHLTLSTRRTNNEVILEISDDGPGIPRANLGRVFDPFFTTKPVGKGTGLGLSICYGIIKKMGGEIEVNSVLDSGTTFTIRIPVQSEPTMSCSEK